MIGLPKSLIAPLVVTALALGGCVIQHYRIKAVQSELAATTDRLEHTKATLAIAQGLLDKQNEAVAEWKRQANAREVEAARAVAKAKESAKSYEQLADEISRAKEPHTDELGKCRAARELLSRSIVGADR